MARQVLIYFQDNLLATIVIGIVAGFLAGKSVSIGGSNRWVFFLVIGLIGSFMGKYALLYFELDDIIGLIPEFRPFFDLLAAYIGSFVLASIIHFLKPL